MVKPMLYFHDSDCGIQVEDQERRSGARFVMLVNGRLKFDQDGVCLNNASGSDGF